MLALVFIILVVGAVVYYKQTAGSDNAKMVKELTRGKIQFKRMLLHILLVMDVVRKQ